MEESIKQILMRRDGMSADEAADLFGLEPDYIWELL